MDFSTVQPRDGLKYGLITWGILFYLSVLGLPLTLGAVVVPLFAVVVGLSALGFLRDRNRTERTMADVLANGLLIGLVAGVGMAVVTGIFARLQADGVDIADVFAQVRPAHTAALTGLTPEEVQAGAPATGGLIQLVLLLLVGGATGGLLTRTLRGRGGPEEAGEPSTVIQRILMSLPLLFFGLFVALRSELINVGGSSENLYGLVISFIFIAAALVGWRQTQPGRERLLITLLYAGLFIAIIFLGDRFQNAVLGKVVIFALIGLGLNIVIGFAGLLDLGYVAYFALGAYTFGLLASPSSYLVTTIPWLEGISFWVGLPLAMLVGTAMGFLLGIPLLRLRGDYLAIVTLGFAEIIRLLLLNLRDYTGGPGGVLNIPPPEILGISFRDPQRITLLALVAAGVVTFIIVRLRDSRIGRAWIAIREDEDVAQVMGINLMRIKLMAFAFGAAFASAGGAFYAAQQTNIFPDNFRLEVSIDIISMVIIGGLGSIEGVILGSVALNGLPEILRGVDEYRIIAFGALLVAMMILRPQGLLPPLFRQEKIADEERSQDAWLKMAGVDREEVEGEGVKEDGTA